MVNKSIGLKVLILPLAVVFLIMFVVLFIQPAYSDMTAKKKAAEASQSQLAGLQQQTAKLSALKTKWDSMEEKQMVQNALPESAGVDDFMSEIYTRISRSGVLLKNFNQQTQASAGLGGDVPYVCGSGSGAPSGDVRPLNGTAAASPQASASDATTSAGAAAANGPGVAVSAPSICANALNVTLSATGTWEQLLTFFQYLGDTNRIANLKEATIKSAESTQQNSNPDLLTADISVQLYSFAQKADATNIAVMGDLASKGSFNVSALQKIKDTVFSAFEEPAVSESGERNVFK